MLLFSFLLFGLPFISIEVFGLNKCISLYSATMTVGHRLIHEPKHLQGKQNSCDPC